MNVFFKKWQKYLETGLQYLSKGDFSQAEKHLHASLIEAEALGVPIIIAFSHRLLATAQVRNNKLNDAESGFQKALRYCLELSNMKGIAEAKAGLASICFLKGEYPKSICLYKQAINIYPYESSLLRLAVLYSDLGQIYIRVKKWDKAEKAFLKAGDLCKDNGYRRGEAEINLYLGEIYYNQGKIQAAKEMFFRAARIFGSIKDEVSLANTHQYLAFIFFENNSIEEALFYQYRVLALYLKHNHYLEISEGYYLLSNILLYAKLLDEAEESQKLSLKYYQGYEFGLAIRYHSLAAIAITKKEYEDAKNYYFKALKFFQFYGDGSKIGEISEELTYLLKYGGICIKENFYKLFGERYYKVNMPKHEIILKLAKSLENKEKDIAALHCGWRALEIARSMKHETQEIEVLIQNLSEKIRKKTEVIKNKT